MSSVDVVIPCYNYAHYMPGCVASILSQQGVDMRVLVIDDCSPDNTAEVGLGLAAADPRVTYVKNEQNKGLIGTANRGCLEWATSEYMLLISADDLLAPGALRRAVAALDAHPEAALAFGPAYTMTEGKELPTPADNQLPTYTVVSGEEFLRYNCETGNPVPSPAAVVRTRMQTKVGAYSANLPHTSDMELWMRLAIRHPVIAMADVQAYYRWHGQNMTALHTVGPLIDRRHRLVTARQVLARDGALIPSLRGWVEAMQQGFAKDALWLAGEAYAAGDDKNYQACMAFAAECDPQLTRSGPSLRHRLKRLVGAKLARSLTGVSQKISIYDQPGDWFGANIEFGRWPGLETGK